MHRPPPEPGTAPRAPARIASWIKTGPAFDGSFSSAPHTDWSVGLLFALGGLIAGWVVGIGGLLVGTADLIQITADWLKTGIFKCTFVTDYIAQEFSENPIGRWAAYPEDWLGLHKLFSSIPLFIAVPLAGIAGGLALTFMGMILGMLVEAITKLSQTAGDRGA